jgi:predicted transcriptional regulator
VQRPVLTCAPAVSTLKAMEVNLNPDLQARLTHLAAQQGRDTETLAREAIERLVDYDEWYLSEVDKGLAQIGQGKVLTHEEVGTRMEKLLAEKQSRA